SQHDERFGEQPGLAQLSKTAHTLLDQPIRFFEPALEHRDHRELKEALGPLDLQFGFVEELEAFHQAPASGHEVVLTAGEVGSAQERAHEIAHGCVGGWGRGISGYHPLGSSATLAPIAP